MLEVGMMLLVSLIYNYIFEAPIGENCYSSQRHVAGNDLHL